MSKDMKEGFQAINSTMNDTVNNLATQLAEAHAVNKVLAEQVNSLKENVAALSARVDNIQAPPSAPTFNDPTLLSLVAAINDLTSL